MMRFLRCKYYDIQLEEPLRAHLLYELVSVPNTTVTAFPFQESRVVPISPLRMYVSAQDLKRAKMEESSPVRIEALSSRVDDTRFVLER